jgi:hypothetical protein
MLSRDVTSSDFTHNVGNEVDVEDDKDGVKDGDNDDKGSNLNDPTPSNTPTINCCGSGGEI